jgi:hypothetical protein
MLLPAHIPLFVGHAVPAVSWPTRQPTPKDSDRLTMAGDIPP